MFTKYQPRLYREDIDCPFTTDEHVLDLVTYVRDTNRHYRIGRDFAYGEVVFHTETPSTVALYANDGTRILHKELVCRSWIYDGQFTNKNDHQIRLRSEDNLFEFHRCFTTGEGLAKFNRILSEFQYVRSGKYDFHTLRAGVVTMVLSKVDQQQQAPTQSPWWKKVLEVLFK